MFKIFQKAEQSKPVYNAVAVIFNIADHESLVAATLYAKYVEERTDLTVHLVDVRDAIPDEMDNYIWIECGSIEHYKGYYAPRGMHGLDKRSQAFLKDIEESSTVLAGSISPDRNLDDTVFGLAAAQLVEEGIISHTDQDLFYRYAMMSNLWLTNKIDAETASAYSKALKWCYHHYNGKSLSLADMRSLSRDESGVVAYTTEQSRINKTVARRTRMLNLEGKSFQLVTASGPELYGLLRRIALAKKDFVHISQGLYGTVVHASTRIEHVETLSMEIGILNLSVLACPALPIKQQ